MRLTHQKFKQFIEIEKESGIKLIVAAQVKQLFDRSLLYTEKILGGQIVENTYYSFQFRYIDNLSKNDSVWYKKKQYSILKIINLNEENKFITIYAYEL